MEINRRNRINGEQISSQKKSVQHDNSYVGEKVTMDSPNYGDLLGRSLVKNNDLVQIRKNFLANIADDILYEDYTEDIKKNITTDNIIEAQEIYSLLKEDINTDYKKIANILMHSNKEEMAFILDLYSKIKENPEYSTDIGNLNSLSKKYKTTDEFFEAKRTEKLAKEAQLKECQAKLEQLRTDVPEEILTIATKKEFYTLRKLDILDKYVKGLKKSGAEFDSDFMENILSSEASEDTDRCEALLKLLENENFYKVPNAGRYMEPEYTAIHYMIPYSESKEVNRNMFETEIVTHILDSEELRNNPYIIKILTKRPELLLNYCENKDIVELRKKLLDIIPSKNKEETSLIFNCFSGIKNESDLKLLETILSHDVFSKNEGLVFEIKSGFHRNNLDSDTINSYNSVLEYIAQDEKLLNSKFVQRNLNDIIRLSTVKEFRENIKKVLSNESLYSDPNIMLNFMNIIQTSDYNHFAEISKKKGEILDYIAENPEVLKNNILANYLIKSTFNIDTNDSSVEYVKKIYEKGLDKSDNLGLLVDSTSSMTPEEQEIKFKAFGKIDKFSKTLDKDIQEAMYKPMQDIMYWCQNESALKILDKALTDKNVSEDLNFIANDLKSILGRVYFNYSLTPDGFMRFLDKPELRTRENIDALCDIKAPANEDLDKFIFELLDNKDLSRKTLKDIVNSVDENNLEEVKNLYYSDSMPNECIKEIEDLKHRYQYMLSYSSSDYTTDCYNISLDFINQYMFDKDFPKTEIKPIAEHLNPINKDFILSLCKNPKISPKDIGSIANATYSKWNYSEEEQKGVMELAQKLVDMKFPSKGIAPIIASGLFNRDSCLLDDADLIKHLANVVEQENADETDIKLAVAFKDFLGKKELSKTDKKALLSALLSQKTNICAKDNIVSDIYPIIPKNDIEYSKTITGLTESLNLNREPATQEEIDSLFTNLKNLENDIKNGDIKTYSLPQEFREQLTPENIELLKNVVTNPNFEKISESDKKIVVVATLLHNVDKTNSETSESAFDAFFIMKKYGMTEAEAKKVYTLIETSDLIDKFSHTKKEETVIGGFRRDQKIIGNQRADIFDSLAFKLKSGNNFELAKILYSAKEKPGLTRFLDKALKDRIFEIKSADFVLLQTPQNMYSEQAVMTPIYRAGTQYNVPVVHLSQLDDFYGYIHSPEADFASGHAKVGANISTIESFNSLMDDKVICADYISKDKINTCTPNGLIMVTDSENQLVGSCYDMYSLGKNLDATLIEYYRDRGYRSQYGVNRHNNRTFISDGIKSLIYPEYAKLRAEQKQKVEKITLAYDTKLKALEKKLESDLPDSKIKKIESMIKLITNQKYNAIHKIYQDPEIKKINEDYVAHMDKILEFLDGETFSPEKLDKIAEFDPVFAEAYKKYFTLDNTSKPVQGVLKNGPVHHNEVLIKEAKVGGYYTTDLNNCPEEYLKRSQESGLPIVVLDVAG